MLRFLADEAKIKSRYDHMTWFYLTDGSDQQHMTTTKFSDLWAPSPSSYYKYYHWLFGYPSTIADLINEWPVTKSARE